MSAVAPQGAIGHPKTARAPLGRLAGLLVPVAVAGGVFSRLLQNTFERVEHRHHHSSRHRDDNQESADEHPELHVKCKARSRETDSRDDHNKCHDGADYQRPDDGPLHDVPYIMIGNVHENGDLLQAPTDA